MFTGIIETTGRLKSINQIGGDVQLVIHAPDMDFNDVHLGDSIASNGICLTVVDIGDKTYAVDVSRETLSKTALKNWRTGDTVNLEKSHATNYAFWGGILSQDMWMVWA